MVENLTASVSELTSAVGNERKSKPNENTVCKHCQKSGHRQENCFQLKTCYRCKPQGHIARHCRSCESINKAQGHEQATDKLRMWADKSHEPKQPIEQSAGDKEINHTVHTELQPSLRILLNIDIGGKGLKFLYDPGSQYSMLLLNIFQQLANKPPLTPINRAGWAFLEYHSR